MNRETAISGGLALAAVVAALLTAVVSGGPLRAVIAAGFLLVAPGLALVRLLRIEDRATVLTLAVAVSLGTETVVATALLTAGQWTPGRALYFLVVLTVIAAMFGPGGIGDALNSGPGRGRWPRGTWPSHDGGGDKR